MNDRTQPGLRAHQRVEPQLVQKELLRKLRRVALRRTQRVARVPRHRFGAALLGRQHGGEPEVVHKLRPMSDERTVGIDVKNKH
jgi:hypothetical protein